MVNFDPVSKTTARNAWQLFAHTGEIGYYLLYKELSGSPENRGEILE